jgi:hypothetical protein
MNTASISGCHALTATATLEAQKMHGSAKIKHWLFAIASISENLRQSFFFVCGHALLYANFLQQLKTRKKLRLPRFGYHGHPRGRKDAWLFCRPAPALSRHDRTRRKGFVSDIQK